ncbi:MAG TPA: M15 family metallopeptidase [Egibacteraceae bacterium]|nr:M15 family metallopeptidase [Egibacteraceae bacterium]
MHTHRLTGLALAVVLTTALGALAVAHRGPGSAGRGAGLLVTWTSGGLPDGFAGRVADLDAVTAASTVRGDPVGLVASWDADGNPVDQPPAGMTIPLDALAVDPGAHAGVLPPGARAPFLVLEEGQALLGERSARLRGLGPGAVLELATGQRVTVAGVVADELVGSAEIVLPVPAAGVRTERFVKLRYGGDRSDAEDAIRDAAGSVPARVRGPGEMEVLRHGGSLLPQVALKERFGEFAFRPREGRMIVQDPAWVEAHVRTAQVPILGEVACHREVLPALDGAMSELVAAGLAWTVDARDYAGCYGPRLIRPGAALSRHAWGIAVDLNATTNAYGQPPSQDPRLVETMARWGFSWGGDWLVPDGMHFEYVGSGG